MTAVQAFSQRFMVRAPAMLSALVGTQILDFVLITDHEQQILDDALEHSLSDVVRHFTLEFNEVEEAITANPPAETNLVGLQSQRQRRTQCQTTGMKFFVNVDDSASGEAR